MKNSQALQQTLARLQDRVSRLGCPAVLASEAFGALQVRCVRGGRKFKTTAWREANRERWRLFERS